MGQTSTTVLVAPLDWGLGHASRCIPVIKLLQAKSCKVLIAAEGAQAQLLRLEFPTIQIIPLKGYRILYSKKWLMLRMASQLLKISNAINHEYRVFQKLVQKHQIDWVISDNRYGLFGSIPSTFITHQLQVQAPGWLKWCEPFIQKKLYGYINRFDACWVPDLADKERSLSGQLGHPALRPAIPVWYTGWLSRFNTNNQATEITSKCLIILSGPEPQRSLLESLIVKQLVHTNKKMILVRGLPASEMKLQLPANIEVYNHLPSEAMQAAFISAEYIISRSGYSTLMDVFTLQKKCIFIPTPGQTEQEYLAERLSAKGMALIYKQHDFNLEKALKAADDFQFHFPLNSMNNLLEMAVDNFIATHFKENATN